jgi:hypothetical protein
MLSHQPWHVVPPAALLSGLEHEAKLYAELARADIPFWTEQQLRQKGLFKTPDALLQVGCCGCNSVAACYIPVTDS